MRIKKLIISSLVFVFMLGCDPSTEIEYFVVNNSKSEWIVFYGSAHFNNTRVYEKEISENESLSILKTLELGDFKSFIKKGVDNKFDTLSFKLNDSLYHVYDKNYIQTKIETTSSKINVTFYLNETTQN